MYFILRDHFTINEISRECEILFNGQFSEKLFRQQLAFHDDIDFSEPIDLLGVPIHEDTIKEFLIAKAIDFLYSD